LIKTLPFSIFIVMSCGNSGFAHLKKLCEVATQYAKNPTFFLAAIYIRHIVQLVKVILTNGYESFCCHKIAVALNTPWSELVRIFGIGKENHKQTRQVVRQTIAKVKKDRSNCRALIKDDITLLVEPLDEQQAPTHG